MRPGLCALQTCILTRQQICKCGGPTKMQSPTCACSGANLHIFACALNTCRVMYFPYVAWAWMYIVHTSTVHIECACFLDGQVARLILLGHPTYRL
jgi:hypothetical protein